MNKNVTDTFHITELFLLAAAFNAETLFGLPDKKTYQLMGSEKFKEAHESLIKKEIFTPDGKITTGGAYVIRALEFYYLSPKYVRIHNVMFGFRAEDEDELIMLMEVEDGTEYRINVISKAFVLKLLSDRFPLILREPKEEEKDFLKEEVSYLLKKELETYEPDDNFMNMEFFQLGDTQEKVTYEQWLAFTKDDELIMVDPITDKYYYAKNYYLMKWISRIRRRHLMVNTYLASTGGGAVPINIEADEITSMFQQLETILIEFETNVMPNVEELGDLEFYTAGKAKKAMDAYQDANAKVMEIHSHYKRASMLVIETLNEMMAADAMVAAQIIGKLRI